MTNPHLQWQRQPIESNNNNNNYWNGNRDVVPYVTKTIAGFMDFVTTVDNTVMVFTPQGLPSKTGKIKTSWKIRKKNLKTHLDLPI